MFCSRWNPIDDRSCSSVYIVFGNIIDVSVTIQFSSLCMRGQTHEYYRAQSKSNAT